jgi:hypothetical protein
VTAADDLHALAVADVALGLVSGVTAFAGPMPAQAPAFNAPPAVSFVVYPGRPSEPGFGAPGVRWEWPRVQVLVRGCRDDLASAESLAEALYTLIGAVQGQTINGTPWLTATCLHPPAFLRFDADHRPEVAFGVECCREVS